MSVCRFNGTPHSKDKKIKITSGGNIQSWWQDVKYYFIFVILFLDVNIVVNTNLYLKKNACVRSLSPPFHPSAASCRGRLDATRKSCRLAATESFCFSKQTADWEGICRLRTEWRKSSVRVSHEQGTFARKLIRLHFWSGWRARLGEEQEWTSKCSFYVTFVTNWWLAHGVTYNTVDFPPPQVWEKWVKKTSTLPSYQTLIVKIPEGFNFSQYIYTHMVFYNTG